MGRSLGAEARGPVATQDVVAPGDPTMTATAQIEPQAITPEASASPISLEARQNGVYRFVEAGRHSFRMGDELQSDWILKKNLRKAYENTKTGYHLNK